jgi:hypothetical protein
MSHRVVGEAEVVDSLIAGEVVDVVLIVMEVEAVEDVVDPRKAILEELLNSLAIK